MDAGYTFEKHLSALTGAAVSRPVLQPAWAVGAASAAVLVR